MGVFRGQPRRHVRAKRELRESRMHAARARISMGKSARVRIAWTVVLEGVMREVEEGMRLVRWIAGPRRAGARGSFGKSNSKEDGLVVEFECPNGGVGRFESGT